MVKTHGTGKPFGEGQDVRQKVVVKLMQLFGMLLRDNERMASAEGLDIKKCKPGRVIYASYYGDIRFLGFKQLVGG